MSTLTARQPQSGARQQMRDYAELIKARVTTLVVVTSACGFFLGARQGGFPAWSWQMLAAVLGVGLVSGGAAALNEVMERDIDGRMRRTAQRPLPAGRMSLLHGTLVGGILTLGGAVYLGLMTNWLTGALALLTAGVYLAVYTPLKQISPVCTFIGAFPGAMPGVLGWTAARGHLDVGAVVLFAIVFVWQFPHFFSIAWLYREDYADGGIRMLPVVEGEGSEGGKGHGRRTSLRILAYSLALIPVSTLPFFIYMAGMAYLVGAAVLGVLLMMVSWRLAGTGQQLAGGVSKKLARQLLQATVIYLPLLFALMMINTARP